MGQGIERPDKLLPQDQASYHAYLERETADFTKAIQQVFSDSLDQPQTSVQFSQQTYATIKSSIIAGMAHLGARISLAAEHRKSLEARVEALETHGIKYCGVWQRANAYPKGSVVSCDGNAWIAIKNSEGVQPGEGGLEFWHLMVRRGRDGRDRQ